MAVDKPIRKPRKSKINKEDIEIKDSIDDKVITENEGSDKKVKRGRKPKSIYNTMDVATTQPQSFNSDDDNIIVQLNIKNPITDCDDYNDDEIPYAYNHDYYNALSTIEMPIDNCVNVQIKKNNSEDSRKTLKIIELLKDFEEKNKNNEWPSNTTIHCYWCCHKFDTPPIGIPVSYNKEKFDVFGCFCSLECAAAHNFKNNHNIDDMWERYNLINLLSRKLGYESRIKPAPDRLSLKQFGGFMEIEQFREYNKQKRFINVNFPPMNSLTQQLEEINDYDLKNDMKYIPIDNDRINKYKEKVLFKRTKPLIDVKNSIESTMNLKYH